MNGDQRDRSTEAAEGTIRGDGGVSVERGACRDLVASDRYVGVWVGIRAGDSVVGVAAAGDDVPPADRTLSLDASSVLTDAIDAGETRVAAVGGAVGDSTDSTTSDATVVVPFWEPVEERLADAGTASRDDRPDGVLVISLDADGVENASDIPEGEHGALETTARTVDRHRARTGEDGDTDDPTAAARFREAFRRHDAVMMLIDPDDGTIRDANDAAVSFYGYPESELIGKPIQEINTASPSEVARERTRANDEERNYFVFDHELASGERRTVEVHSTPIPLADGPVLFSVVHDVTERTEYESELERYGELFENIPVGLFRTRPGSDGAFEEVNPALVELFGADSERDLVGRRPSDLYANSDDRDVFSEKLLEAGVLEEWEHEMERLDGESFWASVSAIRTETPDGPVFDGIVQDVSERKAYEASLEERNERMEVLNQLLRHDIRNDMAVIGGSLDLLEQHLDDEGRERLDTLQSRVDHVVELTHTARNITETLSVESEATMETEPIRLDQVLGDELE
ncbi:MAG: PAS domain S-box protein, partial [Halobaculum sp.]